MANEQCSTSHASVLLLCGLPGSGKSTLVQKLRRNDFSSFRNGSLCSSGFDKIVVIDYDKIAADKANQSTLSFNMLEIAQRNDATDQFNSKESEEPTFNSASTLFDSNDLEAWRKSRTTALNKLKKALHSQFSTDCGSENTTKCLLIIMDDNFHLKSMRRDIYRTCQNLVTESTKPTTIGFVTLYLSTPLQVCIEQNNRRNGKQRVPEDVIRRMAVVMEPPDPSRPYGSFEKHHVTINNFGNNSEIDAMEQIGKCLKDALASPIPPKNKLSEEESAKLEAEKMRQREETLKCQLQRLDQLLRKLVGAVGKIDKSRSKSANKIRKKILDDCKSGVEGIDDEFVMNDFSNQVLGYDVDTRGNDVDDSLLVCSIRQAFDEFVTSRAE